MTEYPEYRNQMSKKLFEMYISVTLLNDMKAFLFQEILNVESFSRAIAKIFKHSKFNY